MMQETLTEIYELLFNRFGPQNWWPGETQFEIIVGAILTQNTNWSNVEKAITNLKNADILSAKAMHNIETAKLAELIRPAGYYNIKAGRLKNFLNWLFEEYDGSLAEFENIETERLRRELLSVKGIGRETADSIVLYAFGKETFVVDSYTARIVIRHELIEPETDYEQLRYFFQSNLPQSEELFNEYHALLVRTGKEFCRPKARCAGCPLERLPHNIEIEHY